MSTKKAATASGGTGLLAAGVVIAAVIAASAYLTLRNDGQISASDRAALENTTDRPQVLSDLPVAVETPSDIEQVISKSALPDVQDLETAEVQPAESEDPESVAVAPTVDEVRVEAGGLMVVAGRAEPGSRVEVIVDGEVVSSAEADAGGAFAALGSVDANGDAQTLTLRAEKEGDTTASEEDIILAPVAVPEVAAAQPPDAAPSERADDGQAGLLAQSVPQPEIPIGDVVDTSTADVPETAPDLAATLDLQAGAETQIANSSVQSVVSEADAGLSAPDDPENGQTSQTPTSRVSVLRSDAAGVSLVQTEPARGVVLDTIGYSDDGVVQLAGRAGPGAATVRAYLDNAPVVRLSVGADGTWRGDVPDVVAGVYTLRIDGLSAAGAVTSRMETPFKREAPAVLAAAVEGNDALVRAITVQAGDTLWAIARDRYGEGMLFVQVFEANRDAIRDPDLIYPGQVFDLPQD